MAPKSLSSSLHVPSAIYIFLVTLLHIMADFTSPNLVENRSRNPFRAWDAFDRIFEEAFSRTKSPPLSPDIHSPTPIQFPEFHAYAHAGATPYAIGEQGFASSNESLGLSGPEDQDRDDPFDKIWSEGLRRTRRSTVTTSKTTRRNKRIVESSGSNSTSTSNSTSRSGSGPPVSSPPPPPPAPAPAPAHAHAPAPPRESVKSPKLKKRKSKVNFKDSADGRTVTATFDLPGIHKSDVHVSYQNDKIVISWESVNTEERMEGNRIVRERREKRYVRTLPLPDGTKFEEVKASMDGRHLVLTYPKFNARKPVQVIEIQTD